MIVDVEGADLSREPITYGHVTMRGPNGETRASLTRITEERPPVERWMHVPADTRR